MSVYQSIFVSICIYMHIFAWISLYILCSFDKDNTKDRLQKTLLQIKVYLFVPIFMKALGSRADCVEFILNLFGERAAAREAVN